jgi:uncharacterized cofD-like protein
MCSVPLDITATVVGADPDHPDEISQVRGQVAVATARGAVLELQVVPADAPACVEALAAVHAADWVVLGPGSWFTSVLPHLLVPELAEALETTTARRLVALNLSPQEGETEGFSPETHLEVLATHAPRLRLDVVLADTGSVADPGSLRQVAESFGARLLLAAVAADDGSPQHDPVRLAAAYAAAFKDDETYEHDRMYEQAEPLGNDAPVEDHGPTGLRSASRTRR